LEDITSERELVDIAAVCVHRQQRLLGRVRRQTRRAPRDQSDPPKTEEIILVTAPPIIAEADTPVDARGGPTARRAWIDARLPGP
jgi:hypothetical protein